MQIGIENVDDPATPARSFSKPVLWARYEEHAQPVLAIITMTTAIRSAAPGVGSCYTMIVAPVREVREVRGRVFISQRRRRHQATHPD